MRDRFEAVALELEVSRDSDGDEWFHLNGVAAGAPERSMRGRRDRGRRQIASAIHDPDVPSRLGRWLAARSGVPFRDRTTPAEREAETAAVRQQLAESGRLGRVLAGWLDRLEARRRRPGSPSS